VMVCQSDIPSSWPK